MVFAFAIADLTRKITKTNHSSLWSVTQSEPYRVSNAKFRIEYAVQCLADKIDKVCREAMAQGVEVRLYSHSV